MNKSYRIILLFFSLLFFQGCTNKLYHGEFDTLNSNDQESQVVIYWTKTEPFIGEDKAGPAILMTECSTRNLTFSETENGIYFLGTPGKDQLADKTPVPTQNTHCGKINNELKFTDIQAGPINIEILCSAIIDDFSVTTDSYSSAYINARNEPYKFEIKESGNWSLFGEIPEAPAKPDCRH